MLDHTSLSFYRMKYISDKNIKKIQTLHYVHNFFPNKLKIEVRSGHHRCSAMSNKCYIL
jgi:hypothetical protein